MHKLKVLIGSLALVVAGFTNTATAKLFDGGIESTNLGKGDWIYFLSMATNKLGGNVSSVTNISSLMSYYQSQGIKFLVVKAGTGSTNFPSANNNQFTTTLVNAAHNRGIKIFGYTRSYGNDIQGEINIASLCYNRGADGFVIDAEAEWESSRMGTTGPTKAINLCTGIKNLWPTKFLAHAPFMYITFHSSFPFKEFGRYTDAVMPQCYWYEFGISPTQCVTDLNNQWNNWQNSLTGAWTNAIKPIAPIAQGWNNPAADITSFFNALNASANPACKGGYRGISFWRTDLHTSAMWVNIKNGVLNPTPPPPGGTTITIDNGSANVVGSWSTGTSATDKFGTDYRYKGAGTGSSYLEYRPNFGTAGSYNVYAWHSQGSNRTTAARHVIVYNGGSQTVTLNQQINGGQWNLLGTFNFTTGTAGYVRINDNFSTGSVVIADAIRFVKN